MFKPVIIWKKKKETIVKFVNGADCLQILEMKKELKSFEPTELDFPENTKIFVNESLCPVSEASGIDAKSYVQFRKYTSFIRLVV